MRVIIDTTLSLSLFIYYELVKVKREGGREMRESANQFMRKF